MWIFLPQGFFSVVQKGGPGWDGKDVLCIRTRSRADLEWLHDSFEQEGVLTSEIRTDEGTDYPFRFFTTKDGAGRIFASLIEGIDYSNFKSECQRVLTRPNTSPKINVNTRMSVLHTVWSALARSWR